MTFHCYSSSFIRLATQSTHHSSFIDRWCCLCGRGEDELIPQPKTRSHSQKSKKNTRKNWLISYKDLRRRKKSGMKTKHSCIRQPKISRACTAVPKFIKMVLRYVRSWISPFLLATVLKSPWLIFLHPSLDNQNITS